MALGKYFRIGIVFAISGSAVGLVSYFIAHNIPFAAVGAAIVVIGATALSLPEQVTGSEAMKTLLMGSATMMEPLLRDIKARQRSLETSSQFRAEGYKRHQVVYLPPGANSHQEDVEPTLSVYVPLTNTAPRTLHEMMQSPTNLSPDISQVGIRVFTPGMYLNHIPELTAQNISIEDALNLVLVEWAELCTSVRASEIQDTVVAEINNVKVRPEPEAFKEILGTLPANLAGNVIATVRNWPVKLEDEEVAPNKTIVRFELIRKQM